MVLDVMIILEFVFALTIAFILTFLFVIDNTERGAPEQTLLVFWGDLFGYVGRRHLDQAGWAVTVGY